MRTTGEPTLERSVEEILGALDIPGNRWQAKGAGLDAGATSLYRAILRAFPELGGVPDAAWLRAAAAQRGIDAAAALAELERRDLVVREPVTGAVLGAYPFSGVPTAHRVELAGGPSVYAMCAVDALGIPFMLDRDAIVVSSDPASAAEVRVEVRAGEVRWEPTAAVVFIPTSGEEGSAAETRCPLVNFFQSGESAEAYGRTRPGVQGHLLTPAEAAAVARRVFDIADLLGIADTVLGAPGSAQGAEPCCPS